MNRLLAHLRHHGQENFWVLPSILTISAIALAFATVAFDRSVFGQAFEKDVVGLGFDYSIGPEGARLTLSTIAGSMITVTSLVFSLTVLALTLASQQLGPRLLRSFMRDRANQIVLGVFIATFVYALLVLRAVSQVDGESFVPYCSVLLALLMALMSFGTLIFFIHHVATSIQADNVIASITDDLHTVIDNVFPAAKDNGSSKDRNEHPSLGSDVKTIRARDSGYVQALETQDLLQVAVDHDLNVRMLRHVGQFVIADAPLVAVSPADAIDDEADEALRQCIIMGGRRTPTQDVDFVVANLVEIAVRALSPGINDHFTAAACVDRLYEGLAHIMRRGDVQTAFVDDHGNLRVGIIGPAFPDLLDNALNEIRQAAEGNVAVTMRLADRLEMLAEMANREESQDAILRHADRLQRSAEEFIFDPDDQARVIRPLEDLRGKLDS